MMTKDRKINFNYQKKLKYLILLLGEVCHIIHQWKHEKHIIYDLEKLL